MLFAKNCIIEIRDLRNECKWNNNELWFVFGREKSNKKCSLCQILFFLSRKKEESTKNNFFS